MNAKIKKRFLFNLRLFLKMELLRVF